MILQKIQAAIVVLNIECDVMFESLSSADGGGAEEGQCEGMASFAEVDWTWSNYRFRFSIVKFEICPASTDVRLSG
jgi:hypothetical protein